MSRSLSLLLLAILFSSFASAETGFRQLRLNGHSERPLDVTVWYPTGEGGKPTLVGENIAFSGTSVLPDAKPVSGKRPLLLISHGYGGNWRNLNWLAYQMAMQGYIVAAVDHPGTTTRNKNEDDAQQLWQRPLDLVQLMDYLLATPSAAGQVDEQRIAALGHSLGGWTVMSLAGARFSAVKFLADCKNHAALGGCKLTHILGIDKPASANPLATDQRDARVKAVVSLDLGLARGFTPESLQNVTIPVLVMAAQADSDDVPAQLESGYLTDSLPAGLRQSMSVHGATHFSFMQECKAGAESLIDAEAPGEGIVCRDGGTLSRTVIHQQLFSQISRFLNQALDYHPLHDGNL